MLGALKGVRAGGCKADQRAEQRDKVCGKRGRKRALNHVVFYS